MFRFKYKPLYSPTTPPPNPVEGLFFKVPQQRLAFGANRKVPVSSRPVLSLQRRDMWAVVLPATTSEPRVHELRYFFTIPENEVRWTYKETRVTRVRCDYEVLPLSDVKHKIGIVSQNTRMNITRWLELQSCFSKKDG